MENTDKNYKSFFIDIKNRIREAQYNALKKVNTELITMYWDIGKLIVEKQKEFGWGKSIVENLSNDLQNEFPGTGGLSSANLWRTRNFYLTYSDDRKLAPLVREIGWSNNIIIMEKYECGGSYKFKARGRCPGCKSDDYEKIELRNLYD
jgi:predicted nuclease of restriction endonuclease-like (RecB) superfamily